MRAHAGAVSVRRCRFLRCVQTDPVTPDVHTLDVPFIDRIAKASLGYMGLLLSTGHIPPRRGKG